MLIGILEAFDQQNTSATAVLHALAVATPIAGLAVWRFGLDGAAAGYVTAHLLLATLLLWRTRHVLRAAPGMHGVRAQQPGVAHG